jgi:HAD superfamily hydrolase (TIGR01509 family)
MSTIDAVIFDLDGVLADTETVWYHAMCQLVAPAEVTWDDYIETIGVTSEEGLAWLKRRFDRPETLEELAQITSAATYQALEDADLLPSDGALDLVSQLTERAVPLAVASQSSLRWVRRTLERIGLADALPTIVTASEVPRGKPAPDIYLHAAARLGADPTRSIAIEDSAPGVAAAVAAGMTVVQLRAAAYCPPRQPGVTHVVESLAEFDLGWLRRI